MGRACLKLSLYIWCSDFFTWLTPLGCQITVFLHCAAFFELLAAITNLHQTEKNIYTLHDPNNYAQLTGSCLENCRLRFYHFLFSHYSRMKGFDQDLAFKFVRNCMFCNELNKLEWKINRQAFFCHVFSL